MSRTIKAVERHMIRKPKFCQSGFSARCTMLCGRSTRTGFYQMAIVLPATLMMHD
jgi:hypothetical protein